MTVHLSTPAAPKTASCGDAEASRFTFWRWKATCDACKAATGAVAYDTTRLAESEYRSDLPVRYSTLVAYARANGVTEDAVVEFERDKRVACLPRCSRCKADLSDPIALLDVRANRMVFACPGCSSADLRARWEREWA